MCTIDNKYVVVSCKIILPLSLLINAVLETTKNS